MVKNRETIFDQSFATQERIDVVLRSLHNICMKPMTSSNIDLYQRNVIRLKKEAQTKFAPYELKKSEDYIDTLNRLREKWGNKLYTNCPLQSQAKAELVYVLSSYEDWLYITLDKHGMLMKDRADDTETSSAFA